MRDKNRKLLVVLLLITAVIAFAGCNHKSETTDNDSDEAIQVVKHSDPLVNQYLQNNEDLDSPVREYGETHSSLEMQDKFVARVLYPKGDIEVLDDAVEAWVNETVSYFASDANEKAAGEEPAELTIDYDSYIIDDNYVSVKIEGIYACDYMAHPEDIVKTFNADLTTKELISLDDILKPQSETALQDMVAEQASIDKELADVGLLNNWLLKKDSIEIILLRGDYLPMSMGTVYIDISYDDLKHLTKDKSLEASIEYIQEEADTDNHINPDTIIRNIDPDKPMIALTFDDGPSRYTDHLLDIFKREGGYGTFFVVGNLVESRTDTMNRIVSEGHEVGGHSWNHRQLTKLSEDEVKEQILSTRAKIFELTGFDSLIIRPPYGSYNDNVKSICKDLGIVMINWSVDTLDWKHKDSDRVYEHIMSNAKDGSIVLCHDIHETTVDAMERVVPDLIQQGFQLVTVSDLLQRKGETLQVGNVYNYMYP